LIDLNKRKIELMEEMRALEPAFIRYPQVKEELARLEGYMGRMADEQQEKKTGEKVVDQPVECVEPLKEEDSNLE